MDGETKWLNIGYVKTTKLGIVMARVMGIVVGHLLINAWDTIA